MNPRLRIEIALDGIKTGVARVLREEHGRNLLLTGHVVSGVQGRDSNLGSSVELGNLLGDGKGKGTSGGPTRPKVPMRPVRGGLPRSSAEAG